MYTGMEVGTEKEIISIWEIIQRITETFPNTQKHWVIKIIWLDIYMVISMSKALHHNPTKFSCELDKTSLPLKMQNQIEGTTCKIHLTDISNSKKF